MVVSVLLGGLGNQMFQCASAYALASKLDSQMAFDISVLKHDTKRDFALGPFNIPATLIETEIEKLSWFRKLLIGIPSNIKNYNEHSDFIYDPEFLNLKDPIRLNGYWQNPKYFESVQDEIVKLFQFNLFGSAKDWEIKIEESKESVSLHVRRGDYVNDQHTNTVHGNCSMGYYQEALEILKNQLSENFTTFIFSDDPEWCQSNFDFIENKVIMPIIGDVEDMTLMSRCKHNIIANSSFSWWGAYLNRNENKQVIAPKKWFNEATHNTVELTPKNWKRI
jgi:hypothetical protein